MSIQNAKKLTGKYTPPESSQHVQRAKTIFKGTDSDTGNPVHFYEKDGFRVRIDALEFPRWRKSRRI